jgi:hypothetical protein
MVAMAGGCFCSPTHRFRALSAVCAAICRLDTQRNLCVGMALLGVLSIVAAAVAAPEEPLSADHRARIAARLRAAAQADGTFGTAVETHYGTIRGLRIYFCDPCACWVAVYALDTFGAQADLPGLCAVSSARLAAAKSESAARYQAPVSPHCFTDTRRAPDVSGIFHAASALVRAGCGDTASLSAEQRTLVQAALKGDSLTNAYEASFAVFLLSSVKRASVSDFDFSKTPAAVAALAVDDGTFLDS